MDHVDHIRTVWSGRQPPISTDSGLGDFAHGAAAHCGPNVVHMRSADSQSQSPLARALGLVIQHEAKRQGKSHTEIQRATGIKDRSFRRWFVAGDRRYVIEDVEKVAAFLGVPMSELLARAQEEVKMLPSADRVIAEIEARSRPLSEAERAQVKRSTLAGEEDAEDTRRRPSVETEETGT